MTMDLITKLAAETVAELNGVTVLQALKNNQSEIFSLVTAAVATESR